MDQPHQPTKESMLHDRIEHDLTNHAPVDGSVILRMEKVRQYAKDLGHAIVNNVPVTREQSLALTHLEQCVMMSIAGIARYQPSVQGDDDR